MTNSAGSGQIVASDSISEAKDNRQSSKGTWAALGDICCDQSASRWTAVEGAPAVSHNVSHIFALIQTPHN